MSLIDSLLGQLQGAPISQIAQHLGTDSTTAQNAIATALPMIVGALGHNAQQPGGASALLQALQDHAGAGAMGLGGLLGSLTGGQGGSAGILGGLLGSLTGGGQQGGGGLGGMLGGLLGGLTGGGQQQEPGDAAQANPQLNASGILGHIFGDAQSHAQAGLEQTTGLDTGKAGQLMAMLAPLVMSHIANHASANNLDAAGLGAALAQERDNVQSQGGLAGDLLSKVIAASKPSAA